MKLALYRPAGTSREYLTNLLRVDGVLSALLFSDNREDAMLFDLHVTGDGTAEFNPPLPKLQEWLRVEPVTVVSLEKPDGK